jgi:replicative DNA helicase
MSITPKRLSDIVEDRNTELTSKYELLNTTGEVEADYISTGLATLDSLGMVERGILTAVAGHTGDGKTAFSMQLIESAAKQHYKPIACFFEDPGKFVSDRLTAVELGESAFNLRKLGIEDENIGRRLRAATDKINDWASRVNVIDELVPASELIDYFNTVVVEETGLISIDYAQAFDSEQDEKSVERVVARLAWGCNQLAKTRNVAVVLYSQVKTEVLARGKRQYDNWCYQNKREPNPSDFAAVEGYRPLNGDMQWSTALGQRCKQSIMIFRPGNWLKTHGIAAKDDVMHAMADKGNYSPAKQIKVLGFDGPRARIYERSGKKL